MKKLLVIICVLLIIFFGMLTYKINNNPNNITAVEVDRIQSFISKIYLWQEISEEALPKFDNINDAPDLWLWEVVKKNLEQYELTYEDIQQKANEIFGEKFTKKFPVEGTKYMYYSAEYERYMVTGIGLDLLEDMFFIKNINKINNGYQVEILEYLQDYSDEMMISEEDLDNEEIEYDIYIKNLEYETIITIKNTESESTKIEKIKENIDKFSIKIITILNQSGNLYVESVK